MSSLYVTDPSLPKANYSKLTHEEEVKLKQIWTYLLEWWKIPVDGTSCFKSQEAEAKLESIKSAGSSTQEKPKKSSSLLSKFYGSSSSTSTTSAASVDDPQAPTPRHDATTYAKGKVHYALEDIDPIAGQEEFWNMLKVDPPDSEIFRFARARKFDSSKGLKMIGRTIAFRLKHKIESIINDGEFGIYQNGTRGIIKNLEIQKAVIYGVDIKNRPYILVRPKFHSSSDQTEDEIEKYALLVIELSKLFMATGSLSILFDLSGFRLSNMDYGPVKFLITCFEAHYPESLGCLLIHKAPWLFSPIWNIIKNWLDPVVASKIIFTKNSDELGKYIEIDQIPKYLGGKNDVIDLNSYNAPDGSDDTKLKDTTKRDVIKKERDELIKKYLGLTVTWIEETNEKTSKDLWNQRCRVGIQLTENYRQLDPYIRHRSTYDLRGQLKL